ncbi:TetR/AcrR family transcriptional regulator [Corynebacterium sp. c25Ua_89]|uniref:TetR/AcrR family transcriptional regulator n=1 Tax=Corynebacterium sp. c25Ua_89 TaxID=3032356 RepID=UPI0039C1DA7D
MSKAQRTRKQQILDAALDVIVEEGVAGLTLRHVANEADTALGSIAYYFDDKDGLISAAFQHFTSISSQDFANYYAGVKTLEQAREATITMLADTAGSRRDLILGAELYSLSLRRPRHRIVLSNWTQTCRDILSVYFDAETTLLLDALYEGLILHRAMHIGTYDSKMIRDIVERVTPANSFLQS